MSEPISDSTHKTNLHYWESPELYPEIISVADSLGKSALSLYQFAEGDESPLGDVAARLAVSLNSTAINILSKIPIVPRLELAPGQISDLADQANEIKYVPRENEEKWIHAYLGEFAANVMRAAALGASAEATAQLINKMNTPDEATNVSLHSVTIERSRIYKTTKTANICHAVGHLFQKGIWQPDTSQIYESPLDALETDILEYLALGYTPKMIDQIVDIDVGARATIKTIINKLKAINEPNAVFIAYKAGLLKPKNEAHLEAAESHRLRLKSELERAHTRLSKPAAVRKPAEAESRRAEKTKRGAKNVEAKSQSRTAQIADSPINGQKAPTRRYASRGGAEIPLQPEITLPTIAIRAARLLVKMIPSEQLQIYKRLLFEMNNSEMLELLVKHNLITPEEFVSGKVGFEGIAAAIAVGGSQNGRLLLTKKDAAVNRNNFITLVTNELDKQANRTKWPVLLEEG